MMSSNISNINPYQQSQGQTPVDPNSVVGGMVPLNQTNFQQNQTGTIAVTTPTQQAQQQAKEINAITLCRLGQETVQEVISRMQELFQTLKTAQVINIV